MTIMNIGPSIVTYGGVIFVSNIHTYFFHLQINVTMYVNRLLHGHIQIRVCLIIKFMPKRQQCFMNTMLDWS